MQKKYMAILPLFALLGACGGGAGDTVSEALGIDVTSATKTSQTCHVSGDPLKAADFNKVSINAGDIVPYSIALHKNKEVKDLFAEWSVVEDKDGVVPQGFDFGGKQAPTNPGDNEFALNIPAARSGKLTLKLAVTDNDGYKQDYFCFSEITVN